MDRQGTTKAFAGVRNVTINETVARAHVMQPAHVLDVVSSQGLEAGEAARLEYKSPPATSYYLDVAGFGEALHAALKDSVVGYTMQLRQNGVNIYTLVWNWAQTPADNPEGWSTGVRMHIASCSKAVTAIAMTKLLNDKNLSYDTPIIGYLPSYWTKGVGIDKITFRHLMTHTSGLYTLDSASDYLTMKSKIADGIAGIGSYIYANLNFGLCRILISTLNGNISQNASFYLPFNDILWDYVTIQSYVQYVQSNVFTPAGVSGPTLDHPATDALAYNFPVSGSGWNSGDLSSVIGGAGWHMSVNDLLNVMGAFRRNGSIMTVQQAQTMLDSGFGIDQQISTSLGTLYNKNGGWGDIPGHVEQAVAFYLPQNMELVALANSPIGSPGQSFRQTITNAYTANIKAS